MRLRTWGLFLSLALLALLAGCSTDISGAPDGDNTDGDREDGDRDDSPDGDTTPDDGDIDDKPDGDTDDDGDEEPTDCVYRCIEISPQVLEFGPVFPGESATRTFEITSTGLSTVKIINVSKILSETSPEFNMAGFDPGEPPIDLAPRQTLTVTVSYTPLDLVEDTGKVVIATNAEVGARREVALSMGYKGTAALVLEPGAGIDWGDRLANNQSYPEIFTLRCSPDQPEANRPLEILTFSLGLGEQSPFELRSDGGCQPPFFMANGSRKDCYVAFRATVPGEFTDTLTVTANDYILPLQTLTLDLVANGVTGEIEINPQSVSFNYVRIGHGPVWRVIEVKNTGSGLLTMQEPLWLENRAESFDYRDDNGVFGSTLDIGGRKVFGLLYEPQTTTLHTAALAIRSNDANTPTMELVASGIGVDECPAAMAPDPANPAQCIPACEPGERLCTYTAEGWGWQECLTSDGELGPYNRCLPGQICVDGECIDLPCYLNERRCFDLNTEQICGINGWEEKIPCHTDDVCYISECRVGTTGCRKYAAPNDAACDDHDACTSNNRCDGFGNCIGDVVNCEDNNPCTWTYCDSTNGCVTDLNYYNERECDDGNPCTSGDRCVQGVCTPVTVTLDCNDGNPCTTDFCDPVTGCSYQFNSNPCNNGNMCTVNDYCHMGVCTAGPVRVCDDGNQCTTNDCSPTAGCIHNFRSGPCEDGDPCTTNDFCNTVMGVPTCVSGPRTVCDDGNPCTTSSCGPGGTCIHTPVSNGTACTDNNLCTGVGTGATPDQCIDGQCVPGSPRNCDDGNICTTNYCDAQLGCLKTNNSNPCDNGDPCTRNDYCQGGVCRAGPSVTCDDSNPCTHNRCGAAEGGCYYPPVSNGVTCNADNNVCTVGDQCIGGVCTVGTGSPNCNDNNPCTVDSCDPVLGCRNIAQAGLPCEDGNICTVGDSCSANGTCLSGATRRNCDDGNPCTNDSCVDFVGCSNQPISGPTCDDGNACTVGTTCLSGVCTGGSARNCDDGNPCTVNSCDPVLGCTAVPRGGACDDGNPCTVGDMCQPSGDSAICVPGSQPLNCDDGNQCTDTYCDPGFGCRTTARHGMPCNDGNACTTNDTCEHTTCKGGPPRNCDDGNDCTQNTCDPAIGCINTPLSGPSGSPSCSDGDPCTINDYCDNGTCVGVTRNCDDGNPCTDDLCSKAMGGCYYVNNSSPCNKDNSGCTVNDYCSGGTCYAGAPANCSGQSDACNTGYCSSTGANSYVCLKDPSPHQGALCNADNNGCTLYDSCNAGVCVPGAQADCSGVADACNNGVCVSTGPSDFYCAKDAAPYEGNSCNAGSACVSAATCTGGVCEPTSYMPDGTTCETDNNPCTDNICESGTCTHPPKSGVWQEPGDCPGRPDMVKVLCTNRCIDKYESRICRTNDCSDLSDCRGGTGDNYWICFNRDGTDLTCSPKPRACSVSGQTPSRWMSFNQAEKACQNAGKRLCTENEWVRACSTQLQMAYPYGDTFMPLACNGAAYGDQAGGRMVRLTGSLAGCRSPSGEYDMSGNVWEWTDNGDRSQPDQPVYGGGYNSGSSSLRCSATQNRHWRDGRDDWIGSRCCVTANP